MRQAHKLISILLSITVCFLLCSCGEYDLTVSEYAPSEENKLVVYTSHKEEVYGPIINEFEKRTGIWVDVVAGGTSEMLEAIASQTDDNTCDIMFGGGVEVLDAYSEYFAPYESTEAAKLDNTFHSSEHKWTVFSSLPIVIIYNNKLVYEKTAPTKWHDLLDESWKNKIAFASPFNSGTSITALDMLIQMNGYNTKGVMLSFMTNLDGDYLGGSGEVMSAVASGTKLVGITLEETALKQIEDGADITMVYPEDGTCAVPDGVAIVENAPHEENARKFLDFVVGEDVQELIVEEFYRRSVRIDSVKYSDFPEINFIDFNLQWASEKQEEILEEWTKLENREETE